MIKSKRPFSIESNEGLLAGALNLPSLLILFFTLVFPIGYTLVISFMALNYRRPNRTAFVGLKNYIDLFRDREFLITLGRTFVFVFLTVALTLCLGILIAILLNEKFRGKGILRTIVLMPWAIPPVVNGVMWKYILDSSYGVLNGVLYKLGFISSYVSFLSNPTSAFLWVVFANVWKNLPFSILLLLAALQTIPKELYESAMVDSASVPTQFFKITIPMIAPTILVVLIFQTMTSIRTFDLIYVLTSGGPGSATSVIGWDLYKVSFQFLDFGKGSAVGYVITILTFLVAVLYFRLFSKHLNN
jgi:ABC-type sugar transport system permease subunit